MSGETLATIHWRALDRDGEDKCRLARLDHGWMLVGHARFRDASGWAALDYLIRLGEDWCTTSADITGEHGGAPVAMRLMRNGDGWTVNEEKRPDLAEAEDVDLSFTPATNLMPLNRLPEVGRLETTSAWLRFPGPQVTPLSQSYTRERGGLVRYEARETGFETHLAVNGHGFITTYPGLWEAEV
ncbi:putative glycolipid-binding domain-containing protein [Mameliella sediminis]|uniref:putative glycolipid-binding domain-containing protein n=1 Tax=Mameliella sediminis TaxID=2836866 RepID=UPI001C473D16|nr:putative glycolipid-binding domain-containing protein [Mameliella sediminis]MBV7395463.1 putative glycolipid-binding domain-containing protein [Mameliella sediminis]MBY6159314.1 putative glycolipid-binding domain-containing protein [Mameliella alba]MBY6167785.1 putative glycolipid-binding domain-containing protein [Mameliella alba]MBY6172806.1 putative glycolipid-binding domain-containing protein [Mameliella alba]